MRDCYEIFGLSRGLTKEEYENRYFELKARYKEDMFLTGEQGNEAAKKLTELESAWTILLSDFDKNRAYEQYGSEFGLVDTLIREGRYDDAQNELDQIMIRNAEWHYYQSVIFYKREWMAECRKHLVIAVNIDSDNPKYKDALEKLDIRMANSNVPPEQFGDYQAQQQQQGMCGGNQLSNCCWAYCCMECCCSLARCC